MLVLRGLGREAHTSELKEGEVQISLRTEAWVDKCLSACMCGECELRKRKT